MNRPNVMWSRLCEVVSDASETRSDASKYEKGVYKFVFIADFALEDKFILRFVLCVTGRMTRFGPKSTQNMTFGLEKYKK